MKHLSTLLLLIFTTIMMAQNQPQPSVDVSGEGIVTVTPDEATVRVRVENTGKDVKSLKQMNDAIVNDVLKFIDKAGIDEKDVKTEYVRLSKTYEYNTKKYTYSANQSVSIKIRDLSRYDRIMNGLLESGINRIDGVTFSSSNQTDLESEARVKAMANAKMKAQEYAGAIGQQIGKAIAISEFRQSNTPQPFLRSSAMSMDAESGGQQTLAPGEMEIIATVNVRFVLN